jgi:diamine N-acetyltransferase
LTLLNRGIDMLKGKKVTLRAIEESHLPLMAGWRSDGASYPFFHEFRPISLAAHELNFAVCGPDGALVGTISLMHIDHRNRRSELGRVLIGEERMRRGGLGREMTHLVLEYAFNHLNLHKVECEVVAGNLPARELYGRFGFVEDGVLRQHVFKDGRYLDVIVLSLLERDYREAPGAHVLRCRAEIAGG